MFSAIPQYRRYRRAPRRRHSCAPAQAAAGCTSTARTHDAFAFMFPQLRTRLLVGLQWLGPFKNAVPFGAHTQGWLRWLQRFCTRITAGNCITVAYFKWPKARRHRHRQAALFRCLSYQSCRRAALEKYRRVAFRKRTPGG